MIISELTMCVCLIILGCYFTVKSYFPYTSDIIGYLPLISCCLYILAYSSGAGIYYYIHIIVMKRISRKNS